MSKRSFLVTLLRPFLRPFKGLFNQLLAQYFDGNKDAVDGVLESKYDAYIRHLYYEISDLRSLVRHLVADRMESLPRRRRTLGSFDHQWKHLAEGKSMLSDPEFKAGITDRIAEFTGLDRSWFEGKRVLDAGCGSGRYTYGLAKLGATVIAVDQSAEGIAEARRAVEADALADQVTFDRHDLLKPLPVDGPFDLVWSYGVLHHTGDTYRAFSNIAPMVEPGGYLFLMLYGEPRLDIPGDFVAYAEYARLHQLIRNKDFEEAAAIVAREKPAEDLHGWFDRVSPAINDCYSFGEIEGWLLEAGFTDIRRTLESVSHHIIARRGNGGAE